MSVVGARPQFVKLAALAQQAQITPDVDHVIVHTGQHYDPALSDVFFRDLAIPAPHEHLGIGSASHGVQTGNILTAMDPVLEHHRPDCVLVYGDTNSTLAATIAAVKLHIPVAHLEAGLRSFNRRMPEEHNRVLVDHAADLLLAPTQTAVDHLGREGLSARTVLVGDVMTDVCFQVRDAVLAGQPASFAEDSSPYVVATIHRAENTDDPIRLAAVLDALRSLETRVLLVAHPRLRSRAEQFGLSLEGGALDLVAPLTYPDMLGAMLGSAGIITDSGGLQKEAYLLGVVCTTLRTETEWVETLGDGWNLLDPDLTGVNVYASRPKPTTGRPYHYGRGQTAVQVVDAIRQLVGVK